MNSRPPRRELSGTRPAHPHVRSLRRRIRREKRFVIRGLHDPKLFAYRARRAASPKATFLELNHDPARTLLLVGSGRSGTTWLAEVLVDALDGRLVFEPLRTQSVPWTWPVRFGHYIDPDDEPDPAVAKVVDRVLRGRVRNRFTDKYNKARFPRCRVVKEVRATNLLPWIVRRYPRTPVVYLLRHPVPTAWSVNELGWPGKLDQFLAQESLMHGPLEPFRALIAEAAASPDVFHRTVLQWCLENYVPIQLLEGDHAHVVFYEQMVSDPRSELERLQAYLETFGPARWDMQMASVKNVTRPSRSNYRGTDVTAGSTRLDGWVDEIPSARVESALALMRGFGLDRLYDISTRPLIRADEVLLGGRRRPPSVAL